MSRKLTAFALLVALGLGGCKDNSSPTSSVPREQIQPHLDQPPLEKVRQLETNMAEALRNRDFAVFTQAYQNAVSYQAQLRPLAESLRHSIKKNEVNTPAIAYIHLKGLLGENSLYHLVHQRITSAGLSRTTQTLCPGDHLAVEKVRQLENLVRSSGGPTEVRITIDPDAQSYSRTEGFGIVGSDDGFGFNHLANAAVVTLYGITYVDLGKDGLDKCDLAIHSVPRPLNLGAPRGYTRAVAEFTKRVDIRLSK